MPGQARLGWAELSDFRTGLVRWHSQAVGPEERQRHDWGRDSQTDTTHDESLSSSSSSSTATAVGVATIVEEGSAKRSCNLPGGSQLVSRKKQKQQREFKFCAQLCSHKCKQSRKKTLNCRRQKNGRRICKVADRDPESDRRSWCDVLKMH